MKIIQLAPNLNNFLHSIYDQLKSVASDELVFISKDDYIIQFNEEKIKALFSELNSDVVFAASADFPFDVEGINLYYWKYYPREKDTYHYVYSNMLMGTKEGLQSMFKCMTAAYGKELVEDSLKGKVGEIDTFHRFYLDLSLGLEKADIKILLDRKQKLFSVSEGRRSVVKWPVFTLRHGFIFHKYEKEKLGSPNIGTKEWDLVNQNGTFYNKRINVTPAILSRPAVQSGGFKGIFTSFLSYVHSLVTIIKMLIYNGGKRKDHEIFRFRHNQNPEIKQNIEKLIDHLETGKAFSFTHFNDGEMTFIKKFEEQDHKEVWFGSYFGRIQEKYNKQLGELLKAAFLKSQDHYYIGIPCEVSHPKLSEYAKALRPVDEFTIPAMTFHHNLSKYPRILSAMRRKKVYFVINVNQDLTFFKRMGFEFKDDQIIRVPFRNAHERYHELKEKKFENGAMVLLMSGMLAKILCAYWFECNPQTTFIAFGSSFDDYIQSKINFNLYPQKFPFSKTLIGSRSYLFGHKGKCVGCYDMSEPNTGDYHE
ncbi:MAG: hypothetical protein AAF600_13850 [Bacteroidota bacterium]